MKIPITRNLSTEVLDLVGFLDVSSETAEQLSRLLLGGATITLHATVEAGEKPALKQVSFGIGGVPAAFPPRYRQQQVHDRPIAEQHKPRTISVIESSP